MMLPPLYCISILFGPRLEMVSRAYCLPVSPTVTTRMIDAEPMTMPSMVSRNRALLARKLSTASDMISLNIIVLRALASVLSNDFASSAGLGGVVVAIRESIHSDAPELLSQAGHARELRRGVRLLDSFQYGSG